MNIVTFSLPFPCFLQRCLEHYNNDSQAVITALLEGSVPLNVSNPELVKYVNRQFSSKLCFFVFCLFPMLNGTLALI